MTALRARGAGRVAVDLDGRPWRVVPVEAVLRAGVDVGCELDRERARRLRRELVRLRALGVASSALRGRDVSSRQLAARLERAGAAPAARREALETLTRVGAVDDRRFAAARATALAERGYGDAAIDADLARQGITSELRAAVIDALAPELERLAPILERRGVGPRTARYAAQRGFGEAAVTAAAGVDFANEP